MPNADLFLQYCKNMFRKTAAAQSPDIPALAEPTPIDSTIVPFANRQILISATLPPQEIDARNTL